MRNSSKPGGWRTIASTHDTALNNETAQNRRSSTITNLRTLLCRRCGKYEIRTWRWRMKQISGRAKFCVVDTNQHNQGASLCYTRHSVRILVTCVRTSCKIMLAVKPPQGGLILLWLNKLCSGSWSVFTTFGSGAATVRKQELGQPPWFGGLWLWTIHAVVSVILVLKFFILKFNDYFVTVIVLFLDSSDAIISLQRL